MQVHFGSWPIEMPLDLTGVRQVRPDDKVRRKKTGRGATGPFGKLNQLCHPWLAFFIGAGSHSCGITDIWERNPPCVGRGGLEQGDQTATA